MNEMHVCLSAGAGTAGTPTVPNAGRWEPVKEEERGEDKRGGNTPRLPPLTP